MLRIELHALRNGVAAAGGGRVVLHHHGLAADVLGHVLHHRHREVADVLAEQAQAQHRAGLEVPLQADVVLGGLVGFQVLVAARAVPALFAGTAGEAAVVDVLGAEVLQAARGGDVAVARARDHLGGRRTQQQVVGQVIGQVEARQHVGVAAIQPADRERFGARLAVGEPPIAFGAAVGTCGGTARYRVTGLARQRIAVGVVVEVVVVGRDLVGGIGVLAGADHAHADVAAQALGTEVGLQVGGVDLFVHVVDEVVLVAGLHRPVGLVQIGDVGRVVDGRERAGVDAAGQVAHRVQEVGRELLGEVVAAAVPVAVLVVGRIAARAGPVAVAGTAVDAAVAVLDAELQRVEDAAVVVPGAVDLRVLLLGGVAGPGRTGRAEVYLQDAVLQVLHQFRRERHRRRAGQVPGAGQVAQVPAAVRVLAAWLERHRELQRRAALGPGAPTLEGDVDRLATPFGREIGGLRQRLFQVVTAGDLRSRHGAVVRTPAARRHAACCGLFLAAVIGFARVPAVIGAGDDGAARIQGQPVEQASAGPVAIAPVAGDVPFRHLDGVGLGVLRQVEAEVVRGQGQVVQRLELQGQLAALALAFLLLDVQVHRGRHHEAGVVPAALVVEAGAAPPVGVELRGVAVDVDRGAAFVAAIPLPAFGAGAQGAGGALLVGVADEHAEALVLVVPGVRGRGLAVGLAGGIGPGAFDGDEAGVGFHLQRTPRVQDHRATDAAFVDARLGRLEQLGAAQHVRRQQRVVERTGRVAVGFCGGDVVAIQLGQGQFRGQSAHADVLTLAAAAGDDHARHALQRVGHVLVGELADVLGGDDFDHRVGVALLLQALLDGIAVAGDGDRIQRGGIRRRRGRLLGNGAHRQRRGGQCDGDGTGQRTAGVHA